MEVPIALCEYAVRFPVEGKEKIGGGGGWEKEVCDGKEN